MYAKTPSNRIFVDGCFPNWIKCNICCIEKGFKHFVLLLWGHIIVPQTMVLYAIQIFCTAVQNI